MDSHRMRVADEYEKHLGCTAARYGFWLDRNCFLALEDQAVDPLVSGIVICLARRAVMSFLRGKEMLHVLMQDILVPLRVLSWCGLGFLQNT